MTNARQITNICGKEITTYQPKESKKYSFEDISRYLRKFRLAEALVLISSFSNKILKNSGNAILYIDKIPVDQGLLAYLAMQLIKNTNDYHSKNMTLEDLGKVADMYYGLTDPVEKDNNIIRCLIRFGLMQFEYQREMRNTIARTLILYSPDFWQENSKNEFLEIDKIILSITGLTLQEILVYSFFFTGACTENNRGFFRLVDNEINIEKFKQKIKLLSLDGQKKYVKWLSTNYSSFRQQMIMNLPISSTFERFRFNPLIKTPIIIPDRNVAPGYSQTYIVPIPQLIHARSTRGLYFACLDYCKSEYHDQTFPNAFGYVFQEYVGLLLKEALKTTDIIIKSEWNYKSKKQSKDSIDWILIRDKTAILIEVKKSCLHLQAKQWGDEEEIRRNIEKTIGKGVKQLWQFEEDINSGSYEKLFELKSVEIFEKLIITHDKADYLNSFIRDVIQEIYPQMPKNYH